MIPSRRPRAGSAIGAAMTLDEWRVLRRRAKAIHRDEEPEVLAPAEAFSDRRADDGFRNEHLPGHDPAAIRGLSAAVRSRIASSCCGWVVRPTSAEFYDAIHAERPTTRQRVLIRMWAREAEPAQVVLAWAEEVYTLRELVAAFHRAKADHPQVARAFNRLARP